MKIGVISDSHDSLENLTWAIEELKGKGAKTIFHLGDIVAPFNYYEVINKYTDNIKFIIVFGNNDGEKPAWMKIAFDDKNIELEGKDFKELDVEGKKVFLTHYPTIAEIAALSGKYDAVFFGHTHLVENKMVERCLLANPGEVLGSYTGRPSCGLWDVTANTIEIFYKS